MSSLTGCNKGPVYTGNEWFISGYGSYVSGSYYSTEGGLKLNKLESPKDGYSESFSLNNVELKIGDSLSFSNKNKSIIIKDQYQEGGSFSTKNMFICEDGTVDVLKSGKYNISIDVGSNALVSITNGEGTADNLNPAIPSNATISLFEHGDYHAAINEKGNQVGILKYASFIKEQMELTEEDDILLSNGDLWQGSYESNVNKGQMLNEFTEVLDYDCFNLGNHEFDWGQENIALNQSRIKVPYLGANIVDLKTEKPVNYVQPFTIVERGDVKIGVIGVIGETQWNSITSTKVDDVKFLKSVDVAKKYSDRLRTEFGCHVIVLVTHAETSTSAASETYKLVKNSEITKQRYVDAIFFGHDHVPARGIISPTNYRVPYGNSGNNGRALAHITLNIENGKVTECASESLVPDSSTLTEDQEVKAILDKYTTAEVKTKANEVVGTASGTFQQNNEAPRLMAKAVSDYVVSQGQQIDIAVVNVARDVFGPNQVTYSELSDAFPFFNNIVVMEAAGEDIKAVANSNYFYLPEVKAIEAGKKYRIATYDFVAYHKSLSREYDNFHGFSVKAEFEKYPVDILRDYWKASTLPLNPGDYIGNHYTLSN